MVMTNDALKIGHYRYLMLSSSAWDEVKVVHKVTIVKTRMNNDEDMVLRLKSCYTMIKF